MGLCACSNCTIFSPECDNIFNVAIFCFLLNKSPGNEYLMVENELCKGITKTNIKYDINNSYNTSFKSILK